MAKAKTKASTTTKKATKKPATPAKRVTTKKKAAAVTASKQQFLQIRITDQTLYWLVFGTAAILFAMWIYSLDAKVRDLYDQIDMNTYNSDTSQEIQAAKKKAQQAETEQ